MDWPKCERCNGEKEVAIGFDTKREFGGIMTPCELSNLMDGERIKRKVPCPACHGSGERDLTADEAAEYLKNIAPYETWFTEQIVWAAVEYRMGNYNTLTAALNARAVRERINKNPAEAGY